LPAAFSTDMWYRVPFDWAFMQCGPDQLSRAEYRSFLTSAVFDDPQRFVEAKAALSVIGHRLLSQQTKSPIGNGALLLIADIMQAGKSCLRTEDFMGLKEHLYNMSPISALFVSSTISTEMIEQGIHPIEVPCKLLMLTHPFQGSALSLRPPRIQPMLQIVTCYRLSALIGPKFHQLLVSPILAKYENIFTPIVALIEIAFLDYSMASVYDSRRNLVTP
jgi:hypothetical protein